MDNAPQSFGQWLKQRRRAHDLTQEDLADKLGCSVETIRKVELGVRRPSKQMAELLAQILAEGEKEHATIVQFARLGTVAREPGSDQTSTTPQPASGLPVPLTTLLGRERDIAAVRHYLLDERVRLVTLTGPPGIGKTHLALQIAAEMAPSFPDGTSFVSLSPISDAERVLPAIASALGVKEARGEPLLTTLVRFLRGKEMLVVLDNFEQVVAAAPFVSELLTGCPRMKALATSRESLHIRGEQLFPMRTLPVPDLSMFSGPTVKHRPSIEELERYPAVALFVRSAKAVRPGFELTAENAPAVAAICARLDGLPLAIELAAARVKLFSPQELQTRLAAAVPAPSLQILTGGPRDLPPRQQTLRSAIEWSYKLLRAGEQILVRRLAVFVAGCSLSALLAVCNAAGDLPTDPLEGLESLLDKSLLKVAEVPTREVRPPGDDQPRFDMFETIREYALEQLAASGEEDEIRRYHAEFYLALLQAAEQEIRSGRQALWFDRLEAEHDNLRAALQWCLSGLRNDGQGGASDNPQSAEMALHMVGVLYLFWQVRGHLTEGRRWIERALAGTTEAHGVARARALHGAGWLALFQGDDAAAQRYCEQSVAMWRETADPWGIALSLNGLGRVAEYRGDYDTARRHYEESLSIREKMGQQWGMAGSLNNVGRVALRQGDYAQAEKLLERGIQLFREAGDLGSVAILLNNLGLAAIRQEQYERATHLMTESLALEQRVDYRWGIPYCLLGFALIACGYGLYRRAARLLGAIDAMLDTTGSRLDPQDQADFVRNREAVYSQLGEEAFTVAWGEGRDMHMQEAIDYALGGVKT